MIPTGSNFAGSNFGSIYSLLGDGATVSPQHEVEEYQQHLKSEETTTLDKRSVAKLKEDRAAEIRAEMTAINKELKGKLENIVGRPEKKIAARSETEICQIARSFVGVKKEDLTELVPKERKEITADLGRLLFLRTRKKESLIPAHFHLHSVQLITVANRVYEQRNLVDPKVMSLFGRMEEIYTKVSREEKRQDNQTFKALEKAHEREEDVAAEALADLKRQKT